MYPGAPTGPGYICIWGGIVPAAKTVIGVLSEKILYSEGCWEWNGWHNTKGYACMAVNLHDGCGQKKKFAHRVVYELLIGPIPEGKQLDHLCRNRGCVNPWHLEPVTCKENLMRGETHAARNVAKTHCPHDHEYTPENTIIRKSDGSRKCRECNKIACRAYERRNPGRKR